MLPEGFYRASCRGGNKNAFGLLYEKYLDEIYRFVYVSLSDHWEAEDITENVFLKTWEQLPIIYSQDSKIDNFRAWLYRIARNLIVDFFRSKKPLVLERRNGALRLLMAIRNEAHRFANTYHVSMRSKDTVLSKLKSIPGIGDTLIKAILASPFVFKKDLTMEDIKMINGIGEKKAREVFTALKYPALNKNRESRDE